jgi:signal transduction histidine kinase
MGFPFRFIYALVLVVFLQKTAVAQVPSLQKVNGYPAIEVFDILVDAKGFLWIASNIGVSKYDGVTFTSYTNPKQSSISATGLVEDKYGRIWFNNFNGQIFYIENEQMKLLTTYDFTIEPNFPHFGLFKDKLVVTSKRGLFVCDLKTLKSHYEACRNAPGMGTRSLSILSDRVIACSDKGFFVYTAGTGLNLVKLNDVDNKAIFESSGTLNVKTYNDTAFLYCNPLKLVYKIVVAGNLLKAAGEIKVTDYVNNVEAVNKGYWINTTTCSIKKPGNDSLKGYDLNCLIIDKLGHPWYGSLQKGLLRNFENEDPLKDQCDITLLNGDIVQSLLRSGNDLIIGTQNGRLLKYNPVTKKEVLLTEIPKEESAVAYLKLIDSNKILFGSSFHTFIYNPSTDKVENSFPTKSIKQADTLDHAFIIATSAGLFVQMKPGNLSAYRDWKASFFDNYKGLSELGATSNLTWMSEHRARAVCCLPESKTIWAAFTNGVFKINHNGATAFLFNNLPVYASSLVSYHHKVIVGTFNSGILIIDGEKVKQLSTGDGLSSNIILKLKRTGDDLWVYNNNDLVQIIDLNTSRIKNAYKLPGIDDPVVTSADEIDGQPFLANVNGLYKIAKLPTNNNPAPIYFNSVKINGVDTVSVNGLVLQSNQNDVQVNLGIPALLNGRDISIRYRLADNGPSKWAVSLPGERGIRFGSLMPGKYRFDAQAFIPQLNTTSQLIHLNFTILAPWWKRWWAISCFALLGSVAIYAISRLYYLNLLSAEKAEYEKRLAVEIERHRISNDMHDDISASLSAIKLYTSTLRHSGSVPGEFSNIYEMVNDLSDRTREVIWSLNKEFNTLESLIDFMVSTAGKLLTHSGVNLKTSLPEHIPDVNIANDKRQDIFMVVKELFHNVLKHAQATDVWFTLNISESHLEIMVRDNGIGMPNNQKGKINGQGLSNIKKRMQTLHGELHIGTDNGTIVNLKIPL